MSYLDRVNDVQTSYNEFKSFLNFYLTTRLNKGFNDVNQTFSNIGLLDLNEFVKDESWLDVSTGSNFPSFFDFPMYVKSYGPGGKLGYGVTPDIGFTRNVERNTKWTQGNMPSNSHWQSVCYGNGKFVAIIYNSNFMAYSTDSISWTQDNMLNYENWISVCYGNGKYVAISQTGNTAYSTDGISWNEGTMPGNYQWASVCYGNDKFVAMSTDNNTAMAYSTDGISWTEGRMPSDEYWTSVCYGNGKYVVTCSRESSSSSSTKTMAYSTDGINWTTGTMPSYGRWEALCYGDGKYVAINRSASTGATSNIMAYSTDGISWTQGNMPISQFWQSVCYGNGKYVAIANTSNIMAYSTDGITWTEGTMPGGQRWTSVCYGNGKFVAISGGIGGTSSIMAYGLDAYSYPSLCYNEIDITYGYPIIVQEPVIDLSINEPENYYFQIIDDNSSNQVFTVPFPSSSSVQYLRNNYSRLFYVYVSNAKNLFVFASYYRSSSYGGLVLYISPDLIHWNVHQLIPGTATSTEANALIGTTSSSLSLSSSNATIMENALRKYVGFLPNGQYVVMYPYEMYKQSGDNMQNMAVLYSPYQSEPLMTINDPYGDEDWENKAINGISAIVDEYGCFDIYYNNRLNCPLSLGLMSVLNPEFTQNSAGEIIGIPVIVKAKNEYNIGNTLYRWNLDPSSSTSSGISTSSGGTKNIDSPIGVTAICTLDKNSEALEDTPINVRLCSAVGNYGEGMYKSITLITTEKTPYAGNTDEDMTDYITEFYDIATRAAGYDNGTDFGISFFDKCYFDYIPASYEITNNRTISRITVIGDTSSNYKQSNIVT